MYLVLRSIVLLPSLAVVLTAGALSSAEPDFGGVTFDFKARSEALFHVPLAGEEGNLVGEGTWTTAESKSGKGVRIRTWSRIVRLPSKDGGDFRLSFRYKTRHADVEKSFVLVYFKNRKIGTDGWESVKGLAANGGSSYSYPLADGFADWNVYVKSLCVRPGCEAVEIVLRTDGKGELEFRDVGLVKEEKTQVRERLTLTPQDVLDGAFEVSEGQCGAIGFHWEHNPKTGPDVKQVKFRLSLPAGFAFLGTSFGDPKSVRISAGEGGASVVTFGAKPGFDPRWVDYNRMTALVRSTGRIGTSGKARLEALVEDKPIAEGVSFELRTSERIAVQLPKRFFNGVYPSGTSVSFNDAGADGAFARFMATCGVQWLVTDRCTDDLLKTWRQAGIRRITPQITMSNGYVMGGDWERRPEEDRFRFGRTDEDWRQGQDAYISRGTCPLAIIEERPFFVTNAVVKSIDGRMQGGDGGWANWEPYMFTTRGCICERCQAAFADWKARTGGTLQDFRSLQHAKVMKVIDKYVRKTRRGAEAGFIPGVTWRELSSGWRTDPPSPESKAQDYAGSLDWINPWGPYFGWKPDVPYAARKNGPLAHFIAAKDVRAQVDLDFPPGARPKLMSFPHGMQGRHWVTQPEHLSMALDSFFFNRWEANVVYFFPQGYDARYWRAFAAAVTRSARYEDIVTDGRRADDAVTLEPVREFAAPCGYVTTYLPKYSNVSLLQQAAFAKDGRFVVAALNFWDDGEAFFMLKAKVPSGQYEVVDETGVRYAKSAVETAWTADDLRKGVLLMVGAARTRVFEIVPAGSVPVKRQVTASEMQACYSARRPRLSELAEEDRRRERLNRVTTDTMGEL